MFYNSRLYWKRIFSILFSRQKKVFILCQPTHANLGDQAQLMCTDKWIQSAYPNSKIIHLGYFKRTLNLNNSLKEFLNEFSFRITLYTLKYKVRKQDLFIGHSGYFMVDHHNGWKMFTDIMKYFPNNKLIIFPQTVNFYTPFIKHYISNCFSNNKNTLLLCRDETSYKNAQELFPNTPLLLYPDIVTSLIGTYESTKEKEGVLFCMRDDIEAFYTSEQISELINRFGDIRKEKIDTTLHNIIPEEMDKKREEIIYQMIKKISSFKVVITDRYHGTIFSAIASTPVIVINSADHKLSSGVNWFPKNEFKETVQFAENLNEAYEKALSILNSNKQYNNPPYFKIKYWDNLKEHLNKFLD